MQEWRLNSTDARCDSHSLFRLQQQVTCLSFSPFVPDLMVAGHSGGLIAVYSLPSSTPLMVIQVQQLTIEPTSELSNGIHSATQEIPNVALQTTAKIVCRRQTFC